MDFNFDDAVGSDFDDSAFEDLTLSLTASFGWSGLIALEGARRQRAAYDALLYDLDLLSGRERQALATQRPRPGDVIAVHPGGARAPGVYRSQADLSISIDALARVAAVVGPGAGPLGATAFARSLADALDEPVLALAPSYDARDLMRDLSLGVFAHAVLGGRESPEADQLAKLLDAPRSRIKLVIAHSAGAWTLSEALAAAGDRSDEQAEALQAVTIGAASTLPSGVEAHHVVGALDAIGWALSDPAEVVSFSPPNAGHHLNAQWPGALDIADMLTRLDLRPAPARRQPRGAQGGGVARLYE